MRQIIQDIITGSEDHPGTPILIASIVITSISGNITAIIASTIFIGSIWAIGAYERGKELRIYNSSKEFAPR